MIPSLPLLVSPARTAPENHQNGIGTLGLTQLSASATSKSAIVLEKIVILIIYIILLA
jgi:hypothetical protein